MKHLIMGTAGHVDHGKTSLIQALTGIDCDTHKQEKQRGMTINLGFAHLDLPDGDTLGVVDVPGHRDFIHTMVGGACGIDLTLLVVAADSGIMPQTREHLQIMDLLGIRSGLVALTRVDLASPDLAEMAEEEIRDFVAGTFLDGCPIVRVSSVTGEGIDALKSAIAEAASGCEGRSPDGVFRLFIDRVFTASGFGTIVGGSVVSGTLRTGDTVHLLPSSKKPLRVRRLERHGDEVDQVVAGDRAAMNLAGLDHTDLERGQVIADRPLRDTTLLDTRVHLFPSSRDFEVWNQVEFHLGTFKQQAKVHLLDCNSLRAGETALAQIHLEVPCVAQHGDRFILRSTSSDVTLGGGEVVDPAPLHHRRRPEKLIRDLKQLADGGLPELVAQELKKHPGASTIEHVAEVLNVLPNEVDNAVTQSDIEQIVRRDFQDHAYLIHLAVRDRLQGRTLAVIADFHRDNPLSERGRQPDELVGLLRLEGEFATATVRMILDDLATDGKLRQVGGTWASVDHAVRPSPKLQEQIALVAQHIEQCALNVPRMSDLLNVAAEHGIGEEVLDQILRHLVETGEICFADGIYVYDSLVAGCRQKLLAAMVARDEGITVAEFRDLVGGNRKACLTLLALYDAEGIIKRSGDVRVLTEAGRQQSRPPADTET